MKLSNLTLISTRKLSPREGESSQVVWSLVSGSQDLTRIFHLNSISLPTQVVTPKTIVFKEIGTYSSFLMKEVTTGGKFIPENYILL